MKKPPLAYPFHKHPEPGVPWSVGIEPICVDEEYRRKSVIPAPPPLPRASDPLNLAHRIKSKHKMEALLLIIAGERLLYEERVIHPGGGTFDEGEDGADGGGIVGQLLGYAIRKTIERLGVKPPRILTTDFSLAMMVEYEIGDLDIDVEYEETDPHYESHAIRSRRVYELEGSTPTPIAMPISWLALGIDPLEIGELLNSIAECYDVVKERGFKESVASFAINSVGSFNPGVFVLARPNMRDPVSFTFVEDIKAWSELSLNFLEPPWEVDSSQALKESLERNVTAQPMIPEYKLPGLVIHICFWPRSEKRAANIVAEIEENEWPVASEDAYPELWIANSPFATLTDELALELDLHFLTLKNAIREEGGPLCLEHDMNYRDKKADVTVTGVFAKPVEFWEPKDNL